jgi:hypothetical protein
MKKFLVRGQPIIGIDFFESVPTGIISDWKQREKAREKQIQKDSTNYPIFFDLLHKS